MKNGFALPGLPFSAKLLISAFLVSMAVNHAFAGWLSWEVANSAAGGAKEHFQYKNLEHLLKISHQHAFGHGAMYFLTGAVFLLCSWREKVKAAIVLLPFAGAMTDLASWWLLKYLAGDYEWVSAAGGTLFSLGFSIMFFRIFYELWLVKLPRGTGG